MLRVPCARVKPGQLVHVAVEWTTASDNQVSAPQDVVQLDGDFVPRDVPFWVGSLEAGEARHGGAPVVC